MNGISEITAAEFRIVLGSYPTGVCIITGQHGDQRTGITIGSFTSISLDPPLVGFFIDRASRRWQVIAESGAFCVNVLGTHQSRVCQYFAKHQEVEFTRFAISAAGTNLPIVEDSIAWIECEISEIKPIGDHDLVVGKVTSLAQGNKHDPLVFCRGKLGATLALDAVR